VAGAGGVDSQQNLDSLDAIGWNLLDRRFGDSDLIGAGVGAGVSRPQHRGGGLGGLIEVGEHRVKAKAALEVAGGAFLL